MAIGNITFTLFVLLGIVISIYAQELWGVCPDEYKKYNPMHSFCLRNCCSCAHYGKGLSKGLKDYILFLHNSFRSKVAGGWPFGVDHLPRATNMLEMVWDDELANLAEKWVYSCPGSKSDCNQCRMLGKYPVGQHVMEWAGKMDSKDLEMEFETFFNGLFYLKREHVPFYKASDGVGKWSQLLWARSWRIGCGYLYYHKDERSISTLVCNYGPGGNVEGDEIYKAGDVCSDCPANSCCGDKCKKHGVEAKYKGLCKVIDTTKPPEGDQPHQKTGKEIFYCAFNGESDCNYNVDFKYEPWIATPKDIGGPRLSMNIGSGWTIPLHFTSPIKSKSGNVCIKIVTRKGTLKPGKTYYYEMFARVELENRYMRTYGFQGVQQDTLHAYQVDFIQPDNFPKDKDVNLYLSFHIPYGKHAQYIEIHRIVVEEQKCKKTTSVDGGVSYDVS